MKRVLCSILMIAAIAVACEKTPVGPETGGITFQVYTIGSTPSASGAAAAAGEPAQVHITVDSRLARLLRRLGAPRRSR